MKHLEKEKQKTERKEHILVCLSFSPSNEKIIRTAAQMVRAFGANFTGPEYQEIARSQLSQKELNLQDLNTGKEDE